VKKQIIKLTQVQLAELDTLKEDLGCSASELKRLQAILLIDCGSTCQFIKTFTGYKKKYASALRKKYLNRGISALKDKKKPQKNLLTKNQRKQIVKMLTAVLPSAFGFESAHWTTSILARIIKEQYGVQYKSKTSLYIIFKEAKFSYHKPDKQYKNRKQDVINIWIKNQKPVIQNALKDEKTVVLVADEMMLSTQTTTQRIWLPQGQYPKIDVSSKRKVRCVYGFFNVKTGCEHAFKAMGANSYESCKALEQIGNLYKGYKIILIWDNASWHKSAEVKDFLAKTKHSFHLINFPPYSPDLNPQEHVWKTGRSNITHNHFIDDIDKATDRFIEYLNNQIFDYKFL